VSKPYAEMLSLSNVSRAKARDIRGFMHVVADCFSPLDVILRKCRLSVVKAWRRETYVSFAEHQLVTNSFSRWMFILSVAVLRSKTELSEGSIVFQNCMTVFYRFG